MDNVPKISVIVPIYKAEKYIGRCARTLFEQTLTGIEYIFIDDCTPDHSMEILDKVVEEYHTRLAMECKTVRTMRMPVNSGQAAVRLQGIMAATGRYIIHCDSDDWVDCNAYQIMYEKAINEQADIVICDYVETDEAFQLNQTGKENCFNLSSARNKPKRPSVTPIKVGALSCEKGKCIKDMMLLKVSWSLCNKLVKHTLYNQIEKFPKDYMGEDMALTLPLMIKSKKIAYCPHVYYYYFINMASTSHQYSRDDIIRRYESVERNLDIVKRAFVVAHRSYRKALRYIEFHHKEQLMPYRKDSVVKRLISKDFYTVMFTVALNRELTYKPRIKAAVFIMLKLLMII